MLSFIYFASILSQVINPAPPKKSEKKVNNRSSIYTKWQKRDFGTCKNIFLSYIPLQNLKIDMFSNYSVLTLHYGLLDQNFFEVIQGDL